jgi:hypothetical protein
MESFKIVLQLLPLKQKAFKLFSTLASQTGTFDIGFNKLLLEWKARNCFTPLASRIKLRNCSAPVAYRMENLKIA